MKIEAGKEYVVGHYSERFGTFAPTQCNSANIAQHPCRVLVESVGRKYAKAMCTGFKTLQSFGVDGLFEIAEAKRMYRETLEARDAQWILDGASCVLGADKINQLVNDL